MVHDDEGQIRVDEQSGVVWLTLDDAAMRSAVSDQNDQAVTAGDVAVARDGYRSLSRSSGTEASGRTRRRIPSPCRRCRGAGGLGATTVGRRGLRVNEHLSTSVHRAVDNL
uniref:Uncharacterized protein n=1 Tax=uncultured Nocardioidaceae bacterium TaxID=253824 RepID=A0A6J4LE05_9ACTN|nr:MAG: hypothetical protein AVDCRST_MAG46-1315 [uncultured Nocardioidaceae bacterium]